MSIVGFTAFLCMVQYPHSYPWTIPLTSQSQQRQTFLVPSMRSVPVPSMLLPNCLPVLTKAEPPGSLQNTMPYCMRNAWSTTVCTSCAYFDHWMIHKLYFFASTRPRSAGQTCEHKMTSHKKRQEVTRETNCSHLGKGMHCTAISETNSIARSCISLTLKGT